MLLGAVGLHQVPRRILQKLPSVAQAQILGHLGELLKGLSGPLAFGRLSRDVSAAIC